MLSDRNAQWRDDARKENYEKLKTLLNSQEDGKINEYYQAYEHMIAMEVKIQVQAVEIAKYKNFFANLSSLLPQKFTEKTIIG